MWILGPIGFTAPLVLIALVVLPIIWLLLRAVPPAPVTRKFPGVALLLGLKDEETHADKTPLWLLLLRMAALAALIFAFAGPVLNPQKNEQNANPLLVVVDGGWGMAPDWHVHKARMENALDQAARQGRLSAVLMLSDPPKDTVAFRTAQSWRSEMSRLEPAALPLDTTGALSALAPLDGPIESLWLSDGMADEGRAELYARLNAFGPVTIMETGAQRYGLVEAARDAGKLNVRVQRLNEGEGSIAQIVALGPDPAGVQRVLVTQDVTFEAGQAEAVATFDLPAELRNRIRRFDVVAHRSAGAVRLTDDSLKRREIGIVRTQDGREGLALLSQLHYLRAAYAGKADVIEGSLSDLIQANPDVLILPDIARLSGKEAADLLTWANDGGTLIRFAGPRLAASDVARDNEDPLLPVRLRAGGRTIGGAMSWGEPKALRAFSETSPFYGLEIPPDVLVRAQVLAQPDPVLAQRTIATLADGTPLVTRKSIGEGAVVLFHVTANAEWSSLPISGLFIDMLDRLSLTKVAAKPTAEDLAGQMLVPTHVLDAFGQLEDVDTLPAVRGEDFVVAEPTRATPAGIYLGRDRTMALNILDARDRLAPANWPSDATVLIGDATLKQTSLQPHALLLGLLLLCADILASLAVGGRLPPSLVKSLRLGVFAAAGSIAVMSLGTVESYAQSTLTNDAFALAASGELAFAYIETGDAAVDEITRAGLIGLSRTLYERTSVEPNAPIAVDPDTDALGFFPLIYWPVTADQSPPTAEGFIRLNAYLRAGGTILFDTRDGDISGFGTATPAQLKLQTIARGLDIPPLEEIPADHVLTRAFYLLQDFPGRHQGGSLWVEAAPQEAEQIEGLPFRNLNDNVSPVIIGGGDWVAAWAMAEDGRPLRPVGRGFSGEQQREIAFRFGVNLTMYILTGNYKSDQVHVPALLERLGE